MLKITILFFCISISYDRFLSNRLAVVNSTICCICSFCFVSIGLMSSMGFSMVGSSILTLDPIISFSMLITGDSKTSVATIPPKIVNTKLTTAMLKRVNSLICGGDCIVPSVSVMINGCTIKMAKHRRFAGCQNRCDKNQFTNPPEP